VVSPLLAATPVVFWDNGKSMVELTGSRPMANEERGLEKRVVLAEKNKRRLLETISSVFIVIISCVVAYLPP
jgi:hypothetical protein